MSVASNIACLVGDFFVPQPLWFGRDEGFSPFGREHLVWLASCALLVFLLVVRYVRLGKRGSHQDAQRRMRLVVALVPLGLLALHSGLMAAAGAFSVEWWPLHVCNLCEVAALLCALRGGRTETETLVGLGVPASVLALLLPGWTVAPAWSLPSVCGFAEHSLVLALALMVMLGGEPPRWRPSTLRPLVILAVYAALIYPFNRAFGTNFAFVGWPIPATPLALWAELFGNPGYIVPYALVYGACVWATMALWRRRLDRIGS